MSKKQIKQYAFYPGDTGVGNLKLIGNYAAEDFLLITNITANGDTLLNFSDSTKPYTVSFTRIDADSPDTDFPFAHHIADGVTIITFGYDTSQYSSTDDLQIFVESLENQIRPWDFGTDAIERMRVAVPQSMLDADFEYGIQPTKWQSLDLFRGYPSIYEIPGSDIAISAVTTNASTPTSGVGPSLITITTVLEHSLTAGYPISLRGVDDSVDGYGKAEGTFAISAVPDAYTIQFYAKGRVGTTNNQSLFTNFTVLKQSGYYTGASIGGSSTTFAVTSQGGSGTFSTSAVTPTSQPFLGLAGGTSTFPPLGSSFTGSGIPTGSQVTSIVESTQDKNVKTSFTAPVTQIALTDTVDLEVGHALDNGSGESVFVTDVTGDLVTLSGPYTVDKTGNNLSTQANPPSSFVNFNLGNDLVIDIERVKGNYTASISTKVTRDFDAATFVYSGSGQNGKIKIVKDVSANTYSASVVQGGTFYAATETITILGTDLGGASPANDCLVTISSVGSGGEMTAVSANGTAANTNENVGTGFAAGESVIVYGNSLGGASPANDLSFNILTADVNGEVLTFNVTGDAVSSSATYSSVTQLSTSGSGSNASFDVTRVGSGALVRQLEEITISGTIEAGDLFRTTIDSVNADYTASAGDTIADVRNGVIAAINNVYLNGNTTGYAYIGSNDGKVLVEGQTAGTSFTIAVATTESGGGTADSQAMIVTQLRAASTSNTSPSYSNVVLATAGVGYAVNDTLTLDGGGLGGTSSTHDLTITVSTVDAEGGILTFSESGNAGTGDETFEDIVPQQLASNITIIAGIDNSSNVYTGTIADSGTGYKVGYQFKITGSDLGATDVTNDMTVVVSNVDALGQVTAINVSGTPNAGDALQFRPSISISNDLNSNVAGGTTYTFTALAEMEVTFASKHGLLPGSNVLVAITSSGSNHDLASGPFLVNEVPTPYKIKYTVRSAGTIATTGLLGSVFSRTDCFYTHRPFDGGVQLGTGTPAHGAQAIRQSKKYIRYQSGKGIMYTSGSLFAPSYDLRDVSSDGINIGSTITVVTDNVDHSLQVGAEVQLAGIRTGGYNNHYVVSAIISENTFTVQAVEGLDSTTPEFDVQPQVLLYRWKGATVRAGSFDDQNGIFFQYDGTQFAVGLRSSTFQLAGTISVDSDSNAVTGTNTRFRDQLKVGDRIVIRGMSHVVTAVDSQTSLSINPDYRGVSNVANTKAALTRETVIPQSQWNLDRADGTGNSGYEVKINKMQMVGFQYSWYGAGFIDWMLRGPNGDYVFIHRMRNNNKNTEAFMRSGNLPVRYEVINEGPYSRIGADIDDAAGTLTLEDASLFPTDGTLYIDNELINYSGKTGNQLTGLSRAATFTNFADGSIRSYTAGAAAAHSKGTGVTLATVTATPQINHWGSAYLTDGKFDEDRGYIFSYRLPSTELNQIRTTLFMIRLSPSVSNAILGDLGERELINRAQLLLKNIDVVVEDATNSESIIIEGILNPSNYPSNPDSVSWQVLNNQGAGGQPSFAQIATDVDWGTVVNPIQAANTRDNGFRAQHYFLKSDISGVSIGDSVSSTGADRNSDFNGTQTVTNIQDAWWIDNQTAYVSFSSRIDAGNTSQTTFTFSSIAGATAVPGEQVFAFTAGATGSRDGISLEELKELTNTPIGGRGAFPNGPDVLAVNAYLTGGSGKVTVNLRWSEAQA